MAQNQEKKPLDIFYLDYVYPEPVEIFSSQYKTLKDIKNNCIFVFDTNVLLAPYDSSKKSIKEFSKIFMDLKKSKKIFIPSRVAREFAKNRPNKISELFLKLRQIKKKLKDANIKFDDYPLLEDDENYKSLKENFSKINELIKDSSKFLDKIESKVSNWVWDDNVSNLYRMVFTKENIIDLTMDRCKVQEDLKFRNKFKIAPGFKDSGKEDEGIGDLEIWLTIIEISNKFNSNVIFVSNDQKNDWFYKQDNEGLYPRFELFDEFRRKTKDKSIHIINFLKFLELSNAPNETIDEMKKTMEKISSETKEYFEPYVSMKIFDNHFGEKGQIVEILPLPNGNYTIKVQYESGMTKYRNYPSSKIDVSEDSLNMKSSDDYLYTNYKYERDRFGRRSL